jgi:hypothetical protein
MNKYLIFSVLLIAVAMYYRCNYQAANIIIVTSEFTDVERYVKEAKAGTVIFTDIDDTVFAPQANMFRASSPDRQFINKLYHAGHKDLTAIYLSNHKLQLVDARWPVLIRETLARGISVYALSQMASDNIAHLRVDNWRYNQLADLGIIYKQEYDGANDIKLDIADERNRFPHISSGPRFYRGIFMSGNIGKDLVLQKYLETNSVKMVIFIDDRLDNVEDLSAICKELQIPYLGINFLGFEKLSSQHDPQIIAIQQNALIQDKIWLEDDEARKLLHMRQ